MSNYPGIDYSGGTANVDRETGIHFGVISSHSLGEGFYDAQELDYGDATCPKCGNPAEEGCIDSEPDYPDWDDCGADYFCRDCKYSFNSEDAYPEEPHGWHIDDDEYRVVNCLDSDAMILKAPYFTYAQYCSPCVPGAGNIETPVSEDDGGVKCYCFGHDWFDGNVAPYPVYSVETGKQVINEEVHTPCPNCHGSMRDTVQRIADAREDTLQHIREQITAGQINVRDFRAEDDTFACFRCDGKGFESSMVAREV